MRKKETQKNKKKAKEVKKETPKAKIEAIKNPPKVKKEAKKETLEVDLKSYGDVALAIAGAGTGAEAGANIPNDNLDLSLAISGADIAKDNSKDIPLVDKIKSFCKEREAKQITPEKSLRMEI